MESAPVEVNTAPVAEVVVAPAVEVAPVAVPTEVPAAVVAEVPAVEAPKEVPAEVVVSVPEVTPSEVAAPTVPEAMVIVEPAAAAASAPAVPAPDVAAEPPAKKPKMSALEKAMTEKIVNEKSLDYYLYKEQGHLFASKYFTWIEESPVEIPRPANKDVKHHNRSDDDPFKPERRFALGAAKYSGCKLLVDLDEKLKANTNVHTIIIRADIMKMFVFPTKSVKSAVVFNMAVTDPLTKVDIFADL